MKSLSQFYRFLIITVGLTSVLISMLYGNEYTVNIKPVFHLLLLAYYIISVQQIKIPVLVFFVFAMIGETLVAKGFETNYPFIAFLFAGCFASGVILLHPLLQRPNSRFKLPDVIALLVVVSGMGYIMVMTYIIFTERLQEYLQFGIVSMTFLLFTGYCFYIAAFHFHPKKLSLFVVGSCYIITVIGTLLHELYYESAVLMGIVNISEIVAQFSFAYFAAHYYKIRTVTSELI